MKRILSGFQPTGNPHLGNYFGAMKHHIALQGKNECYYFIADYHALTTIRDPQKLQQNIHEVALDYLALGLDPKKVVFFRQSSVPEHAELTWILSCITNHGLLERAHAWKDAIAKKKKDPSVGLFIYPVLMAADILMYQPQYVPVGQDQKQHVEMARDIAIRFNHLFGETFVIPEPLIDEKTAVIPGTDGQKMSKSYKNTIAIFAPEDELKNQIMGIVTDSTPLEKPKNPETCTVFNIIKHFLEETEQKELAERYRKGGLGYGEVKKMLFTRILDYFADARKRRAELEQKKGYTEDVLKEGAKKAQKISEKTMADVYRKIGLA